MDTETSQRLKLLITASAAFAMMGAGLSLYGPSVLSYQRLFDLSLGTAGWVLSAHWIGSLSGVLTMFFLPGRIGTRTGLVLLASGAVLLGSGLSFALTLLGAVILGLGYGTLTANFNPRILSAYGAQGPAMLALINAVFSLGAIAAPFAFSQIASHPERLFVLMGVLTLVIAIAAGAPPPKVAPSAPSGRGFRIHLPILVLGAIGIGMEVSVVGLGPSALVHSGLSEKTSAQLLSAFYVAFLIGRIALIFIAHKFPSFAIFVCGAVLTFFFLLGCAAISPFWFFAPMGFAIGLFFPGYFVTGIALLGNDPRSAPFLIGTAQIGAMVLPLALSQTIEPFGLHSFFWAAAVVALVLFLVSASFYPRLRAAA
jgi:FHS family glucose/mannose:H+ symporter-like MFS transporter